MYNFIFTEPFNRKISKFLKKNPEMEDTYRKCLELLKNDPFYPSLRLHKLKGNLKDLYSVSITIKYRMTIEFLITSNTIIPVNIGTHEEVYH